MRGLKLKNSKKVTFFLDSLKYRKYRILHGKWQRTVFSHELIKNSRTSERTERVSEFLIKLTSAKMPFATLAIMNSLSCMFGAISAVKKMRSRVNAFFSLRTHFFHWCFLIEIAPNMQEKVLLSRKPQFSVNNVKKISIFCNP